MMFSRKREILHEFSRAHTNDSLGSQYKKYLCLITLSYFILFSFINIQTYRNAGFDISDFGAYIQVLWYAGNGEWPVSTANYPFTADSSWFGFHFTPLLFVLAPFFRLFGFHPEFLSIIHVFFISISSFFVVFSSKNLGLKDRDALLWGLIFLANPITINGALFSFQEHSLALPLFALCFWALTAKNIRIFALCLIGILLSKEHYGLAVGGFGALWGWYHKEWLIGGIISFVGIMAMYLVIFHIMPAAGGQHSMFIDRETAALTIETVHLGRYSWLKLPWPENVSAGLKIIASPENIIYYIHLFIHSLYLALLGFIFLLPAVADFLANSLSDINTPKKIIFYHSLCIVPSLIIASIAGTILLQKIVPQFKKFQNKLVILILIINILATLSYSMIFPTISALKDNFYKNTDLSNVLKTIPSNKSISVPSNLGPFFARRKEIYLLDASIVRGDIVVFVQDRNYGANAMKRLNEIVTNEEWGITYWDNQWVIMERGKKDSIDDDSLRQKLIDFYK